MFKLKKWVSGCNLNVQIFHQDGINSEIKDV